MGPPEEAVSGRQGTQAALPREGPVATGHLLSLTHPMAMKTLQAAGTAAAPKIAAAGAGNPGPVTWRAVERRHHQAEEGQAAGPRGGARRLTGVEGERPRSEMAAALGLRAVRGPAEGKRWGPREEQERGALGEELARVGQAREEMGLVARARADSAPAEV